MKAIGYHSNFIRLGKRNYVQGSELIKGLLEAVKQWKLGQVSRLKTNCKHIINAQGIFELLDEQSSGESCCSVFDIVTSKGEFRIGLMERDDDHLESVPYDEAGLIQEYHIDSNKKLISFDWHSELPVMRVLIALQKQLLNQLLPSSGFGRWVFFKCDLDWQKITEAQQATIKVQLAAMLGQRTVKCEIWFDQEFVGVQFFTRPRL